MKFGETTFQSGEGVFVYENPVNLFMYDGPMETVEYMREYIWCMLD